ncbi:MAG TPA: alcohol dehydrogenase catalytic domain-containing protein [Bryobacteraceae bacterium]|nr:alcohol dehydrogenase catalytic domain-containing protein [Bryobacteraceae bacterium]
MQAMVLRSPGQMGREEMARPVARAGEALVRVTHTGVCGTDLKIYNGAIRVECPLVMGHEVAGEVVESGASGLARGDRVIVDPVLFCGRCFHCRKAQTNLCSNGKLIGRDSDGGFAEYVVAPATHAFRLPDAIDLRTAPLVQVAATCLHGQRRTPLFAGESVVVLGLGVSGQLHVQIARARGAGLVIGVSRGPFKREMARALGADLAIESGEGAVAKVLEATGGRGADVVIESTGVMPAVAEAIRMARFGGQLLLFGIISAREGALPFYDLYFKELTVRNGRAAKAEDFPEMLGLVERGAVRLEPLVTHRMPLGELESAIGMVEDGADGRLKIILDHT